MILLLDLNVVILIKKSLIDLGINWGIPCWIQPNMNRKVYHLKQQQNYIFD